jgi:signal peptidase I
MLGGTKKLLRSALRWALRSMVVATAGVFLLIAIGPRLGLYQTVTVLSGSMRPAFTAGDLLVLRPERLTSVRTGQVLTYSIPIGDHHVESHRIVQVVSRRPYTIIRTKGDANAARDPWTAVLRGRQAWHVVGVVPYAGRPILWLREPIPHLVSVLLAPALFLVFGLLRVWTRRVPDGSRSNALAE